MTDIYADDVTLKDVANSSDGNFRLDFLNTEKDEHIHIVVSRAELLNILRRVGRRCEATGIVQVVDIRGVTEKSKEIAADK